MDTIQRCLVDATRYDGMAYIYIYMYVCIYRKHIYETKIRWGDPSSHPKLLKNLGSDNAILTISIRVDIRCMGTPSGRFRPDDTCHGKAWKF